jgi:hypothetical protein
MPAAAVQVPSRVGVMCGGSLGTGMPFASWGTHMCIVSLHQLPPAQSLSTLQPPAGAQSPLELHVPERHTTGPFIIVQGPSPFA